MSAAVARRSTTVRPAGSFNLIAAVFDFFLDAAGMHDFDIVAAHLDLGAIPADMLGAVAAVVVTGIVVRPIVVAAAPAAAIVATAIAAAAGTRMITAAGATTVAALTRTTAAGAAAATAGATRAAILGEGGMRADMQRAIVKCQRQWRRRQRQGKCGAEQPRRRLVSQIDRHDCLLRFRSTIGHPACQGTCSPRRITGSGRGPLPCRPGLLPCRPGPRSYLRRAFHLHAHLALVAHAILMPCHSNETP